TENFDLSSLLSGASHVKVRFRLRDAGTAGNSGAYGWAVDDILVWVPSNQEASITGIQLPYALPSGCGLSNETIEILIANNGGGVISGGLTASFQRDNGTITTENVGKTIQPGDTTVFTFNALIDLSSTQDTNYQIKAWISLTNDPNQTNDTLTDSIVSRVALADPVINDTTIPYATSVTLHAVHNDSITWYSDPLAQNMLQYGSYYTTPILFDTTTYYCQAGGGSIDSITTIFAQNNGSTGNMFDITTTNTITIDSFYINGDNSALMEVWYRVGTYVGHTSSNTGWIKLGDYTVTTAGVDQPTHLPIGGLTIPANQTYGIYVTYVSGSINYTNGTGTNQIYTDANMTITCGHGGSYFNLTNTPRVWNGTIFYRVGSGGGAGCPSAVKPVKVMISGIPHQDAGVEAVTEPSGLVNSGIPYDVKVKIKNHGIDTITKVTIGWDLDGTPKTSYLWTGSLPNDSVTAPITIGSESFTTGVHKIKAWTTMPNDSVDWANWNDTALANVFVCLEDTLTIGGSNPDFATIQDALAILDSVGVCGHTVFNIAPGTYTGQLTINPIMGASDSATVQFRSATGINTDVVLQYSASTTTDNWVVRLNSADYITFRDLTIKATNASYATVVEMINGATYNTIEGCLIQSTGTSSYNRGIYDYNTLNHYNTYKNNVITGGYYGMYIYGTSSSAWQKGTVIEGNEISDFYYYGILCYYQDSAQIIGNYIHDGTYSYSYGIYTYYNFNGFNISGNNISL
ncbi:right-handed parallel beta-helix repeat-containing protein, partial [candidate division KSB1 bacterium]